VTSATEEFRSARDFLLANRADYDTAYEKFVWPRPAEFNFAIDWFDAALTAEHPERVALRIIEADGADAERAREKDIEAIDLDDFVNASFLDDDE